MSTKYAIVSSISNIPQCWFFKDHMYIYMENGMPVTQLPTVHSKYQDILESHEIPFKSVANGEYLEFWSPEYFEEVTLTLPLFIRFDGGFRQVKNYSGKVATLDSTDEAFALYNNVVRPLIEERREAERAELKRLEEIRQTNQLIQELSDSLKGRAAVGITKYSSRALYLKAPSSMLELEANGRHFRVFPVYTLMSQERQQHLAYQLDSYMIDWDQSFFKRSTDFYVVFDMEKIQDEPTLTIPVPAGSEPIFVGRGGWQVKEWRSNLGVWRINVTTDV